MAFSLKTWVDRISEFPNRRKLDTTGITDTYDVVRSEGIVSIEGDKFDSANMNDLENRTKTAFDAVETIADSAVQSATIGGAAVPKSGTTLQLPAYPTSLPANGGTSAACSGNSVSANYANSAGSAPANGGTSAACTGNSATAGTANYAHYSSHAIGSSGAAVRNITMSTAAPSGGQDGDVWHQYK